jgi:DNA mismatch endonuclease (patch repair protein)
MNARPSPADVETSIRMKRVRRRDTRPEITLRSLVHRLGLRYAIDARPLGGLGRTADIVFRSAKVAVFVDGCFWHGCPLHATWPKHNGAWWRAKILRNRSRDVETDEVLARHGWVSVRVWEHEDPNPVATRLARIVRRRRRQLARRQSFGKRLANVDARRDTHCP